VTIRPIQHGGNQAAIRRRLGLGDRPLLDASVAINPLGPPPGAVEAARRALERAGAYPDPGCPRLVEQLAERHKVPREAILVGAGTTELIGLLAQALRDPLRKRAVAGGDPDRPASHLVEPIYAEYRRAATLNGLGTRAWPLPSLAWSVDFVPPEAEGIYWTGNPVSPLGHAWPDRPGLLRRIDERPNLLFVVDEAYLPFFPEEAARTLVADAPSRRNLVVLRSVTKIYAIPGLRIGYAVGPADLIERLRRFQNPWSVDSAAEAALRSALGDDEYHERTTEVVGARSAWLIDRVWDIPGLRPAWPARRRPADAPPCPNWVLASLVETPWTSPQLQDALARRGLYVRECSNFRGLEVGSVLDGPGGPVPTRGHVRIAVRNADEAERLLTTLADLLRTPPEVE
jgi:threonine-phosphate decarboxylase